MPDMGKHSRLSKGQRTLAAFIVILAAALTPVFFAVMFTAVTRLLAASFGSWSWTVPVATEISFTLLFLLWVLLEWRDRAPGWLRLAPYPFATASLWLNVYSARGNLPGMVGHGVVTVAFFLPLLAMKAAVTRLTVSDEERRRDVAARDAIDHARDILRAADPWWRFRAPVLLRRQLRSRRLPAAVTEAIASGVTFGGASKWEPAVEAWITRSLALPEGVSAQLAAAREAASQVSRPATPEAASAPPAQVTPEPVSGVAGSQVSGQPEVTVPATPQARSRRKAAATPRRILDADLKEEIRALFDADPHISINAAADHLHRSRDRVRPLLEEVRRDANVRTLERKRS
jgi:hypothetical protein